MKDSPGLGRFMSGLIYSTIKIATKLELALKLQVLGQEVEQIALQGLLGRWEGQRKLLWQSRKEAGIFLVKVLFLYKFYTARDCGTPHLVTSLGWGSWLIRLIR